MSLLLVTLLGIAALVVDLGGWQVEASEAQQAADAAALAGVVRLPDGFAAARDRALEVAADNGFDELNDPGVDVIVRERGTDTLEVTVTRLQAGQFFSSVFRPASSISRTSTAQYVQPVPLGSPRNYLGTNVLPIGVTGDGVENFYLAISGKCMRREYGDRVGGKSASNPPATSSHSCATTGNTDPTAGIIDNPEFDEDAYFFGVMVPQGASSTILQMFDAPVCTARPGSDRIFGEQLIAFDTEITIRRNNALDPIDGDELANFTVAGRNDNDGVCRAGSTTAGECSASDQLRECWTDLLTLPGSGEYTVQIQSVDSGVNTRNERHNVFSLRAKTAGGAFSPCTSDVARDGEPSATPIYSSTCPQVFGLEHLPIYARGSSSPLFFLSSIDDRHANKTLQVTFYDTAEGATGLELVDAAGTSVPFDWEILCDHGTPAPSGGSCPGENQPVTPRSGSSTINPSTGRQHLDLPPDFAADNYANRTYGTRNVQRGGYSDRLIRITYELPADFAAAYGDETWWKVRYLGDFDGDRTTWTVQLLGDPVRLLPNAPTTTTTTPGP